MDNLLERLKRWENAKEEELTDLDRIEMQCDRREALRTTEEIQKEVEEEEEKEKKEAEEERRRQRRITRALTRVDSDVSMNVASQMPRPPSTGGGASISTRPPSGGRGASSETFGRTPFQRETMEGYVPQKSTLAKLIAAFRGDPLEGTLEDILRRDRRTYEMAQDIMKIRIAASALINTPLERRSTPMLAITEGPQFVATAAGSSAGTKGL